jgi:hypothetical protein
MPLLSAAVVVCYCRRLPLPLLSFAIAVVVVRCRCCPLRPSSASAAIIATPCLCRLLPPALVCPLHSLPPNLACHCCPPLSLSAFAVIVRRRRLPPPQPSSPLCCLRRLSPPGLVLPHCSPPLNHACRHCPPPSRHCPPLPYLHSSSLLQDVDCCIVSCVGPQQQVLCDGINVP